MAFVLVYNDRAGKTLYRTVTFANVKAISKEAARKTKQNPKHVFCFLENKLKRSEGR